MQSLQKQLNEFWIDEGAATAIEYALIASMLSIAIIGSVTAINGSLVDIYEEIQSYIVPALEGTPGPGGD